MNTFVNICEIPFNLIFLVECILKIVALGFYGKKENKSAYIRVRREKREEQNKKQEHPNKNANPKKKSF